MSNSQLIKVDALEKTYRDGRFGRRRITALKRVSLELKQGEIFGLLGPNGAGKTTLIKVLLGIVRKSGGRAVLLGRAAGDRRSRARIGYLPENHRIPQHHTGNSALEYYGSLSGLSGREIRRRRPSLLATVGLDAWGGTPIRKYSKGMLQRLGMAQAMLHEPELLILDEPTDGVDPVGRAEMRDILQQWKATGKSVFLNSHLLQEVELICDRVAILNAGEVLREGSIDELTTQSLDEATLVIAGTEAAARQALEGYEILHWHHPDADQYEVTIAATSQDEVDRCVDALRAAGLSLVALDRNRQTLEEAFLSIVQPTKKEP